MIFSRTSRAMRSCSISGACCVETTMVVDAHGLAAVILDGDLALAVGPQVGQRAVLARLRPGAA